MSTKCYASRKMLILYPNDRRLSQYHKPKILLMNPNKVDQHCGADQNKMRGESRVFAPI